MLDRPYIITADNHPEDCAVFIQNAHSVGEFLRATQKLVQDDNEHRILCWEPPKTLSANISHREIQEERALWRASQFGIRPEFRFAPNIHLDYLRKRTLAPDIFLGGSTCNLTQTLQGQGTYFYHIPPDNPDRDAFYKHLFKTDDFFPTNPVFQEFESHIKGPFMLAAGSWGLILPRAFGTQATLHGLPIKPAGSTEKRRTLIVTLDFTGPR